MVRYNKGYIASGHPLVSEAAKTVLAAGGNAFDAAVAAGFASAVVEPALTSLGGGGFLLAHVAETKENIFFDFFVDVPGKGRQCRGEIGDFFPVTVQFSGSAQEFYVGSGSVAVPGTLKGLLHVQRRLGRMPLSEVLVPAMEYAAGHRLNDYQGHFLALLQPIMTLSPEGVGLYQKRGRIVQPGESLHNPQLVSFLARVGEEGEDCFYQGDVARAMVQEIAGRGGILTEEDLRDYQVVERKPMAVNYKEQILLTAPEPSAGGTLVALSLLLAAKSPDAAPWGGPEYMQQTAARLIEVERLRAAGLDSPQALERLQAGGEIAGTLSRPSFTRGTTHLSIADRFGNCASMTCSNGEGSGYFAPGTGVMLNNMMGEDDLHPLGFHAAAPGGRVISMMAPSLVLEAGNVLLVLGSGGSKRIRSAISQVLVRVLAEGCDLAEAVASPRMHFDGKALQVEPGFPEEGLNALRQVVPISVWPQQDVYFGGVHAVMPGFCGVGDARRGGSVASV